MLSDEGAQQGDPIGPLLFCNTIHPVLSSLEASLKLGYLDDVNLGVTVKTVASDVAKIIRAGSKMGFPSTRLNVNLLLTKIFKLMTPCCSHSTVWSLKMSPYWERLCFPI